MQLQPSLSLPRFEGRNLASALMLGWAPGVRCIGAWQSTLCSPKFAEFTAAATQLTTLYLTGSDIMSSARADKVLQGCHSLQQLVCRWRCVPTWYPQSIQDLSLELDPMCQALSELPNAGHFVDALVLRLARLQYLRRLTLHLGDTALLPTAARVPELQRLSVSFSVAKRREPDLSWLQAQPHQELCVHVSIEGNVAMQRAASQQLQGMQLHDLGLAFLGPCKVSYQRIWQPVTAGKVSLFLDRLETPIELVPAGQHLRIHAKSEDDEVMTLAWQMLTAASCVSIYAGECHEVRIRCPGKVQDALMLDKPWQLLIQGATAHPSELPRSLSCTKGLYGWQNQAAAAAGWDLPVSLRDTAHDF